MAAGAVAGAAFQLRYVQKAASGGRGRRTVTSVAEFDPRLASSGCSFEMDEERGRMLLGFIIQLNMLPGSFAALLHAYRHQ